jgi:hypothetical protein
MILVLITVLVAPSARKHGTSIFVYPERERGVMMFVSITVLHSGIRIPFVVDGKVP